MRCGRRSCATFDGSLPTSFIVEAIYENGVLKPGLRGPPCCFLSVTGVGRDFPPAARAVYSSGRPGSLQEPTAMSLTVEAIYEDGVLKPAQPLPLNEHETVRITIEPQLSWAERTAGILQWTGDFEDLRALSRMTSSASGRRRDLRPDPRRGGGIPGRELPWSTTSPTIPSTARPRTRFVQQIEQGTCPASPPRTS